MEIKISDFILEVENFFSEDQCNQLIKYYEKMEDLGFVHQRSESVKDSSRVSDKHIYVGDGTIKVGDNQIFHYFNNVFWQNIYPIYMNKYGVLNGFAPHKIHYLKIQKTKPGGDGYHVWHCERSDQASSDKIMFFILYLNDVHEGGETEFLYLSRRIKPKAGKLILSPAQFTHTHRGNPPLSNEKYILTGWVEFD